MILGTTDFNEGSGSKPIETRGMFLTPILTYLLTYIVFNAHTKSRWR